MGFWNALSVLAPVAPALSDAQDIRTARQQDAAKFAQDQDLFKAQLTINQLAAQAARQRNATAAQEDQDRQTVRQQLGVRLRSYTKDDGAKYTDYWTPTGVKSIADTPTPESLEKQQLASLKRNRAAIDEMMPDAAPEQRAYIAELVSGIKAGEPRATPIKTSSTIVPDPAQPGMGTKIIYDQLNGQIYSKEPALLPRGYQATQTDSWRFDPMLGMMVNSGSTRTPIIPGVTPVPGAAAGAPKRGGQPGSGAPVAGSAPGAGGVPAGVSSPGGTGGAGAGTSPALSAPVRNPYTAALRGVLPKAGGATPAAAAAPGRAETTTAPTPAALAPPILRYPSMSPQINKVADSMASLQQQFVGDGNDPLWGYADLMDNPPLRQAINLALTANMNPTPQTENQAGIGSALATVTGLTNWAQKINNQNAVNARNKVQQLGGQRAVDFVDRLAELKGSIPALRTITGASAAQGSITPLIQESPVLNTSNSYDFRKRTAYTMRTLGSALRANPAINPAYSQWLFKQADEAEGRKSRSDQGSAPSKSSSKWVVPSDAPPAPPQDGKLLKVGTHVIARSQGGKWVQP